MKASDEGIGHLETPIAEELFSHFAGKLSKRLVDKITSIGSSGLSEFGSLDGLVERLETPSVLRTLVTPSERSQTRVGRKMSLPSVGKFFDVLSFPFLASGLVAGSMFATARVLHGKRTFSDTLAQRFPQMRALQRVLWLTDTFADKNGVSSVLQLAQKYALENNLPTDFLVCLVQLLEFMKRAEKQGLLKKGFASVDTLSAQIHAISLAFADRAEHFGDRDFWPVPAEKLLSGKYLDERWQTFQPSKANLPEGSGFRADEKLQTTHFSVIDAAGNAVAVTETVNGNFGSAFVPQGTGLVMNNQMDDFSTQVGVARIQHQWKPTSVRYERNGLLPETVEQLRAFGYGIEAGNGLAVVYALERTASGRVIGVPDPRGEGFAAAE